MNHNIKKILSEYRLQRNLYADYCQVVQTLLERLLQRGGYKYYITSRIKSADSLRQKIINREKQGLILRRLNDICDIAGLRIIFYIESDISRFIRELNSVFGPGLLIKENTKESGYQANHVIISFGPERTRLSEYAAFSGLKCELQLVSILNHAWAEIEHDLVYKGGRSYAKPESDRGTGLVLRRELEEVMKNYLKKASTELDSIFSRFNRIKNKIRTKP